MAIFVHISINMLYSVWSHNSIVQVYALEAEIFLHASRLSGMLVIKAILCGQDTKSK